jgi:hypothetical protein
MLNHVDPARQQRPSFWLRTSETYAPEQSKGIFIALRDPLDDGLEIPVPCDNDGRDSRSPILATTGSGATPGRKSASRPNTPVAEPIGQLGGRHFQR